jgi:hypothetical protein
MRIGGVGTQHNTSDILTKNLQPPLHIKHTRELNIVQNEKQTLTNCATKLTLNLRRTSDDPDTSRNHHLPQNQQLPLSPSPKTNRPPITAANTDAHAHIRRQRSTTHSSQTPKEREFTKAIEAPAKKHRQKHQPGTLEVTPKHVEILGRGHDACHDKPEHGRKEINPDTYEMPTAFLDLIFPQQTLPNGYRSQPPRRCDKITHTINTKTQKKHRKRKSEALPTNPA